MGAEQDPPAFSQLYRDDEDYLTSDEVVRRIAPSFRRAAFDRVRGKAEYHKEWERLKKLNAPEVILGQFSSEDDRTVWVQISDDGESAERVSFVLWARGEIWIEHPTSAAAKQPWPTVAKLAGLLGYTAHACQTDGDRDGHG